MTSTPSNPLGPATEGEVAAAPTLREVTSMLPISVVAVTAVADGEPVGLTIGSFLSLSVDPPRVGFVAATTSKTLARLERAGSFCVNLLTAEQAPIAGALAAPGSDKFAGVTWEPAPETGSPVLADVAAWIDCRITEIHDTGDHRLVIGDVADITTAPGSRTLMFQQGRFFGPPTPEPTATS